MAFGKTKVLVSTISNPLRFPGQYHDDSTGMSYNFHRYYGSNVGRYTKADPLGLTDRVNLYAYVSSDPINFIDPKGLIAFATNCKQYVVEVLLGINKLYLKLFYKCAMGDGSSCINCPACKYLSELLNFYRNATFSCKAPGRCATVHINGTVYLNTDAINESSGCGCLEGTLLHEALHAVGEEYNVWDTNTDKERVETERKTYADTKACISCANSSS